MNLWLPTEHTTAFPEPVMTKLLDKRKGSGFWVWLFYSVEPLDKDFLMIVSLSSKYGASSTEISLPSKRIRSAGILIPLSMRTISPTTKSHTLQL